MPCLRIAQIAAGQVSLLKPCAKEEAWIFVISTIVNWFCDLSEASSAPCLLSVTFSFLLAPQSSSSLPTRLPRTPPYSIVLVSPPPPPSPPLALILVPCPLRQHPPSLFPFLYSLLTLLNTEPPRSMDLPWISPGSPLHLTDTHLQVFPWFPFLVHLHLRILASSSLCPPLSRFYLWSLVPPLTSFHIDSSSLCHCLLSYSLNSTMTHLPWLIASSHFVYKPLAQPMYSLSYSYSFVLAPSLIHLVLPNSAQPLEPQDLSFSPVLLEPT